MSLIYLPMQQLAELWSNLLLAEVRPRHKIAAVARATGSVLRPPATSAEIGAAQERLGTDLPASYRDFLLVSNGAYAETEGAVFGWPEDPCGTEDSSVPGVGFLPVEDVRWMRELDPSYASFMDECDELGPQLPVEQDGVETIAWSMVGKGLSVATRRHPGAWSLVPFPGLVEWQLIVHWKEVALGYRSFRSMLEHEVVRRTPLLLPLHQVRELLRRAAYDDAAKGPLSLVVTPEATQILLQAVVDGHPAARWAASALARQGGDDIARRLAALDTPAAREALGAMDSPAARDALAELGDYWSLCEQDDPRAYRLAAEALLRSDSTGSEINNAASVLSPTRNRSFIPLIEFLHSEEGRYEEAAYQRALALLRRPGYGGPE